MKIQRLQNRFSRLTYGKNCTHELDRKIFSHDLFLQYTDILYFFKCRNNFVDIDVTKSVLDGRVIRGEQGAKRLIPPRVRTTFYKNGFVYRSTTLWNTLPSSVKLSQSTDSLKKNLKFFFFFFKFSISCL
jgi:hypothetical protein